MNPKLTGIAERQGGPFTRAQALSVGVDDDQLRHLVRIGVLHRLRRGAYVETNRLIGLDEVGRHLLDVRAVALSLEPRVAFSHASAAALHRLALWRTDLSAVHVTRLDTGAPRQLAGVHHHVGALDEGELTTPDGLRAVSAGRAAVELTMTDGFETGVVAADSALHQGATTVAELTSLFHEVRQWPGATSVGPMVASADGQSESVGETRARLLFSRLGLPTPQLQRKIYDDLGTFVGRVDFLFADERTIVEFDGRVKYRGEGPDASATVVAEKLREDRLRELGYQVVRLTWADLERPERTAQRLRAAFARARATRTGPARGLSA